jgi:hypothetical protein
MFKNTTRRGLAIGAAIAIAFSGLVTSPAQAAGEVVLAPSAGTAYNTFVTEGFTLQASMAPGQNPATAAQLKYKIDKVAGATVSYAVSTSAPVAGDTTFSASSTTVVVAAAGASGTTQNFIRLNVTGADSASSTVDVTVTAFVDSNNNSTLDAGEFNTPQTVSFKKYSEVASVVALTQPAEGDTTLKGTASLTGINTNQVQKLVTFSASVGGAAQSDATLASGVYSTTVGALAGAATVSAVVKVDGHQIGAASATLTVTAKAVKSVTASAVAGDNAKNGVAGAVEARVNSAFVVKGTALNSTSSTAVGVAGAAVTVKVTTSATLTSTKSITVNGTVYTSSNTLAAASFAVTADAAGVALVNVTTAGLAAADKISFLFTSQNTAANVLEATLADAAYTVKSVGVNNYRTVATSSAFAIDYTVADQFAVALPAGHRLVVAYDGTTKYVPVSGGAAKAEFTSTASATTSDVTNSGLEKQNTTTLNWATVSATTATAVAVKATTVAAKFDTAPTHSAAAVIARATTSNTAGFLSRVTISGKVNHPGQSVSVTSTGVQFSTAAQDAKAVANTITTLADGSGVWTVSAYVTKAGAATFTYAAGAATASTTITAGAALGNEGTVLTITSVDTILPGKTLVATVKLVDEHGNAVAADDASPSESFSVTVTGLGFVGALPTKLNASGEATVAVLLGSADEGSVVITATYDADGTGTAKAAVTTTKTVAVAPAVASEVNVVVGSFNGRWAVRTENAKGSAVSIKVGGKWFKATATSDSFVFSRKSKVGATVLVKVWVAGDLQNEQTITVK